MDIAELAKRTGLPASTLRYYEERGLIRSTGRSGLRRLFAADVIERLSLIALGQAAGLSLAEIAPMLASGQPDIDRALLRRKADEIDSTLQTLMAMRDGLRHAAECSAPSHMECPTFRRLLGLAAAGVLADGSAKLDLIRNRRRPARRGRS